MKNRIRNAIVVGWWGFKNPQTLNQSNFKMLSDLLVLILKVANEHRHIMSHIAYVHPDDNSEQQIVSIWCGSGIGAEPTKRISELLEENRRLKLLLSENINKKVEITGDTKNK